MECTLRVQERRLGERAQAHFKHACTYWERDALQSSLTYYSHSTADRYLHAESTSMMKVAYPVQQNLPAESLAFFF